MAQAASRQLWSLTSVAATLFGDNWDLNITGTYTVNTNAPGTMTFTGNHRRHFVIGDGGRQLRYVGTNLDGDVAGGSMVKQ